MLLANFQSYPHLRKIVKDCKIHVGLLNSIIHTYSFAVFHKSSGDGRKPT